jgi:hypothetical protein
MTLTETAPYGSPDKIIRVLERYRETGLGGSPITPPLVQKMQMGSEVARRVVQSLKELELTSEDGTPTSTLIAFEKAPSTEYKSVLANHLLDYYSPVFAVLGKDTSNWTPIEVEDQFREFKPKTLRGRMVSCFLGLCEYAGIVDPLSAKRSAPRTTNSASTRTSRISSAPRTVKKDDGTIRSDGVNDPIAVRGASETVSANLSSGGMLLVALSGRVTDLNSSERQFVFQIFDWVKELSNRKALMAAAEFQGDDANADPPVNLSEVFKNENVR